MTKIKTSWDQKPRADEAKIVIVSPAETAEATLRVASSPPRVLRRMMGVKEEPQFQGSSSAHKLPLKVSSGNIFDFPAEFDARLQWPDCPSLREIRDQGGCGSCWALGAVESMTNRHCIAHKTQFYYSSADSFTCCLSCGAGCDGRFVWEAFKFWRDEGIVSGGKFDSK
ncbi:hypothetical protein HAZT_HAZT007077 [Hyalella azteca]|uniref:Peptidase C1A papain C-terminal domain-containing protein n=1 Tax=Hyalella azteca TaxID=294128 RepID=A0A6A0GRT3_HYAAZ|nr:hypothetical protein HAZT_HAZT007077 [Hyalella azteca]